jgi:hypothetical protein
MMRSHLRATLLGLAALALALALGCSVVSRASSLIDAPGDTAAPDEGEPAPAAVDPARPEGPVVRPDQFEYLGAFRLPGGGDQPFTFACGGWHALPGVRSGGIRRAQ